MSHIPTYVQSEGDADQVMHVDSQSLEPLDTAGETTIMYIILSAQYYARNTSAVRYCQTESNLMHGTTAGQLLAQENLVVCQQQSQTTNLSPTPSSRNRTNAHQGNSTTWITRTQLCHIYLRMCRAKGTQTR
jgi:hypothetical protein